MTRTLKMLGLAMMAALALSAVAASAASADLFEGEEAALDVTGQNTNGVNAILTVPGTSVKSECEVSKYSGTATNKSTSITVHPTYSNAGGANCDLEPVGSAPVVTTGCNYIISSITSGGHAGVQIECSGSSKIEIQGPGCTVKIGSQTPDGGVVFDNQGTGSTRDVEVTATVTGIDYTSSGFLCGLVGVPSSGTNATYTDSVTVKGYKDGSAHGGSDQRGIWVNTT